MPPRPTPSPLQNFVSSVLLPLAGLALLPVSLAAVALCLVRDVLKGEESLLWKRQTIGRKPKAAGTVMISGGRMAKGLHLARAFKRAGWHVIGLEEYGWGELCPLRFSSAVDDFRLLPSPNTDFEGYSQTLIELALQYKVDLFIPVCGAGSTVEDAKVADEIHRRTKGQCQVFIQDVETSLDLHDKDRFSRLVEQVGMATPHGKLVHGVDEGLEFLKAARRDEKLAGAGFILKCTELDENRGDLTLYPAANDDAELRKTRKQWDNLKLPISKRYPYVIQEFIPGQEWCTHASVVDGQVTAFVTCPSNDMLMTYEDWTTHEIGKRCEQWTREFLSRLAKHKTEKGQTRRLTGHFSFDFIHSERNGELYPIECNPRVHTAIIMLDATRLAACYQRERTGKDILRPDQGTLPRTWLYNDLIMRYLPYLLPFPGLLRALHPSLPACCLSWSQAQKLLPRENPWALRIDPALVADDPLPFLVLYHFWWPALLIQRWAQGKQWTRLNVSTGRIFQA